jgi:hypothetical protein
MAYFLLASWFLYIYLFRRGASPLTIMFCLSASRLGLPVDNILAVTHPQEWRV